MPIARFAGATPIAGSLINVYFFGTQIAATIYADDLLTPLGNPFTSDALTGEYLFFADDAQGYDQLIGAVGTPISPPSPGAETSSFGTASVQGGSAVVATQPGDALQFVAGANVTLVADNAARTITVASTGGGGGGGAGTVTNAAALVANQLVLGAGADAVATLGALGTTVQLLHGNAAGVPTWGPVNLATEVSGVLPAVNFATGTPNGAKFLRDDQVWTAIPGGGDALTASPLSQFAATTSAQLRAIMTDEVGTGPLYFQGGALGTPASGVGTNLTAIPTAALTGALLAANEPVHTGDVTNAAASLALTIAANAVTNAKLATMPTGTLKANITGGAAVPTDVTYAEFSTAMNFLETPLAIDTVVPFGTAILALVEVATPAAPAANGFHTWIEDNGAGKSRWMCRFGSGAAIQIAIEP